MITFLLVKLQNNLHNIFTLAIFMGHICDDISVSYKKFIRLALNRRRHSRNVNYDVNWMIHDGERSSSFLLSLTHVLFFFFRRVLSLSKFKIFKNVHWKSPLSVIDTSSEIFARVPLFHDEYFCVRDTHNTADSRNFHEKKKFAHLICWNFTRWYQHLLISGTHLSILFYHITLETNSLKLQMWLLRTRCKQLWINNFFLWFSVKKFFSIENIFITFFIEIFTQNFQLCNFQKKW
jgi:hypothetical protein